jgi:hypothetical protein
VKATRDQISELAETIAMQSVALAGRALNDAWNDVEIRARALLIAENARTLEVWTVAL